MEDDKVVLAGDQSVRQPDVHQTVSQCHSEALAEESLIRNVLISLDSSLRSELQNRYFLNYDTVCILAGAGSHPLHFSNNV
jgi:hypothetical protein